LNESRFLDALVGGLPRGYERHRPRGVVGAFFWAFPRVGLIFSISDRGAGDNSSSLLMLWEPSVTGCPVETSRSPLR
jgi:hypothetical protein